MPCESLESDFYGARRVAWCWLATLLKSQYQSFYSRKSGAIAQLGERIVRNDEVVGSIPTSSTKS
jgi:hypothetical protein